MYRIFLTAVDVVPAAVVLIPLFVILYGTVYRRNGKKCFLCCLFCLYLAAVFSLVGIPNVTYVRVEVNLNLIPIWGMLEDLKNSILNVLLFIPMGVFLTLLWREFCQMRSAVLFGMGVSLGIELLQIFTFRATDVNDLITNGIGTFLGWLLMSWVIRIVPSVRNLSKENKLGELYTFLALTFAIMFFIHPLLSPAIWDRLL